MNYQEFLKNKMIEDIPTGILDNLKLNPQLFDFQKDIVKWAIKRGRAAIFADCGLGKTPMQLEWANQIHQYTKGNILILAPLAVAMQTQKEGEKFGIKVKVCRTQKDVEDGINITNYEMISHFDISKFIGVVLDESSILKSFTGKTCQELIDLFQFTKFRLACTATPAPNDYMELGNHSEFLGVLKRTEMLSTFFVHDMAETAKWRLKGHAENKYWKWISTWAVVIKKPSDLGYNDDAFTLPKLNIKTEFVDSKNNSEFLFALEANTLDERRTARKDSKKDRAKKCLEIIIESWTNNKRENITNNTESRTGEEYLPEEKNGITKTQSANVRELLNMQKPIKNKEGSLQKNIEKRTEKNLELICEKDTQKKENRLSHIIKKEEQTQLKEGLKETGIYKKNLGLPLNNMKVSSIVKEEDALSAGIPHAVVASSQSIIATNQIKLEESFAHCAIELSDNSMTIPYCCAKQQNISKIQWIVWCDLNSEQDEIANLIGDDCVSIYGSLSSDEKIKRYNRFSSGEVSVLITKASIFGFGINMQFSNNQAFLGLSDSYEKYYQAVRRQWRFGQKKEVNITIILSKAESSVLNNIKRKEKDAMSMGENMVDHTKNMFIEDVKEQKRNTLEYKEGIVKSDKFEIRLGDCIDHIKTIPDNSIHYSIFSPPFASLYTYSASERDMGNCRTHSEFYQHFEYLVSELHRVIMPGRLLSFHCMNLPTSKERDGFIGINDFRGELIKMFKDAGFIFHSEVCIWKDPVTAMQRTKALGLLHKQIKKDSCMSRQGIPDFLVTMRKHGDNPERVTHTNESFPVSLWQNYASPVWMDINPSDTLQKESARENNDERHICPLQLQVIERAVNLWTNPNDLVLSPFAGIGSEGYQSIKMGRRYLGFELKESYFKCAVNNLRRIEKEASVELLFDMDGVD